MGRHGKVLFVETNLLQKYTREEISNISTEQWLGLSFLERLIMSVEIAFFWWQIEAKQGFLQWFRQEVS